jgi:AAA family ATP:ADP antiporter
MPSDPHGVQAADGTHGEGSGSALQWLRRAIDVRGHEIALLGWSWLYVLSIMSAYYVVRPIRDALGVEGGVENLQWLFTGTLLVMLAINPAYAAIVRILPRRRFIALAYLFFIVNLSIFALLLQVSSGVQLVWVGRAFFIWVSVFNLFVVSVFWALMVDIFDSEQGKRLFGFLAAGATLGAIFGSGLTASLSTAIGATWLLLASAALLLLAILSVRRLSRLTSVLHRPAASSVDAGQPGAVRAPAAPDGEAPIGGSVLAGLTHTVRSPYLLNISLYILLYSITSTFLYFQQAAIVRDYFPDRASRTSFFAGVDLAVNVLTLVVQLFLTSRFLRAFGVAVTAAVLPFCTLIGFGALAAVPTLAVFVVVQVVRRVGNFGLARPTRELLFTVVSREDKYKAKSVIDTVVYRAGDQVGSWSYALLGVLGAGPVGVALAALPISAVWLGNALWLGGRQKVMAGAAASPPLSRSP